MARIVATLNDCNSVSSSLAPAARTRWSQDFIGIECTSDERLPPGKMENLEEQRRLDGDGKFRGNPCEIRKTTGSGECQAELSDGSLSVN
jgi:hypothetical protein